jgi:hypothetical protein
MTAELQNHRRVERWAGSGGLTLPLFIPTVENGTERFMENGIRFKGHNFSWVTQHGNKQGLQQWERFLLPRQQLTFLQDFGLELLKLSLLRYYRLLNQFEIPHVQKPYSDDPALNLEQLENYLCDALSRRRKMGRLSSAVRRATVAFGCHAGWYQGHWHE